MIGRLIVGLIWLTFVRSEDPQSVTMMDGFDEGPSTGISDPSSSATPDASPKTKRYLSHQHTAQASPCPPYYPNFGMHMRMHDARPYGPPAYPKLDLSHGPMHHQSLQYVHAPSYTSYVPHQSVHVIKSEHKSPIYQAPIYKAPIYKAPIYQAPHYKAPIYHNPVYKAPVTAIVKQPSYYQHYQPPMYHYAKQPVYAYAPAYPKPMTSIWPATIKKYDYPAYHQPALVYKPEAPKCAPCPSLHSPEPTYVKVLPAPVAHVEHHQPKIYLPPVPLVHPGIVKSCVH